MTSYCLRLPAPPTLSQCTFSTESILSFAARVWRPSNIWKPKQRLWGRLCQQIQQVPFFLKKNILFLVNPIEKSLSFKIKSCIFTWGWNSLYLHVHELRVTRVLLEPFPAFIGRRQADVPDALSAPVVNKENVLLILIFCLHVGKLRWANANITPGLVDCAKKKRKKRKIDPKHKIHVWQITWKHCTIKGKS